MYQYDLYGINRCQIIHFMTHYYNLSTTIVYNFTNSSSFTTFYDR